MNLNIRFPRNMWKNYLIELENYSEFCRDAIIEKIQKEFNGKYIDNEVNQLESKIDELKNKKKLIEKNEKIDQDKIREILEYHALNYQKNAQTRSESQRFNFLEKSILPEIHKFGYKGSTKELDALLINYPLKGDGAVTEGEVIND